LLECSSAPTKSSSPTPAEPCDANIGSNGLLPVKTPSRSKGWVVIVRLMAGTLYIALFHRYRYCCREISGACLASNLQVVVLQPYRATRVAYRYQMHQRQRYCYWIRSVRLTSLGYTCDGETKHNCFVDAHLRLFVEYSRC
jgi:hypothetical protein